MQRDDVSPDRKTNPIGNCQNKQGDGNGKDSVTECFDAVGSHLVLPSAIATILLICRSWFLLAELTGVGCVAKTRRGMHRA